MLLEQECLLQIFQNGKNMEEHMENFLGTLIDKELMIEIEVSAVVD